MLRSAIVRATKVAKPFVSNATARPIQAAVSRCYSATTTPTVTDSGPSLEDRRTRDLVEELKNVRSTPICGYETRRIYQMVHETDVIPEPELISEFMRSCRACNDFALAIRILESIKRKCGKNAKVLWPYIAQEIRPTLDELGIPLPEEMGYDKPELYLESVFDIH